MAIHVRLVQCEACVRLSRAALEPRSSSVAFYVHKYARKRHDVKVECDSNSTQLMLHVLLIYAHV